MTFKAKDFIKTPENLYFAVIKDGVEKGKVLACLRYLYTNGIWKKFDTLTGNKFLQHYYPHYLYFSKHIEAHVHGVALEAIEQHEQPRQRLQTLLEHPPNDKVVSDLITLCQLFLNNGVNIGQIGITGSLLIGAQKTSSDIDLVFYQRECFHHVRHCVRRLIATHQLAPLSHQHWKETFARRACELNFEDYLWHEQRKHNKVLINGRKVDLTLSQLDHETQNYTKQGKIFLTVKMMDDRYSFDYPAKFIIDHPHITTVLCFSATYSGQAKIGEWVDISGQLEITEDGSQQIIIGADREAKGEFIRVIRSST